MQIWKVANNACALRWQIMIDFGRPVVPPVALIHRQWFWERDRKVALEEELGVLVTLDRDGLIAHWQPFADRDEALRAAGIG